MYMSALPVCVYVYDIMSSTYGGQQRVLDSLKLELRMVMSFHMSAESPTQFLCNNNKCS